MAIKDVNNHPKEEKEPFFMETLSSHDNVISYIDNVVVVLEDLDPKVAQIVREAGTHFLNKSISHLIGFKSMKCKIELHDALKHRSDDLITLVVRIIEELGSEETIDLTLIESGESDVQIVNKYTGELIWDKKDFNPKFTKLLLHGIVDVLKQTRDRKIVREALRCLLSFSTVYKDIRGSKNFIIQEEEAALERLKSTKYTTNEQFERNCRLEGTLENEFFVFMQNFLIEDVDDPLFVSLTAEFRNTLKKFARIHGKRFQEYDQMRDSNMSFKSSGTAIKYRGKTRTIPAIIASAFEEDKLAKRPKIQAFDEYIGFVGRYGFLNSDQVKSKYRPTISIPQKKLARRVIHLGDNARQDRLGFIHNLIAQFFKMYKPDCTFDQGKGIKFALKLSGIVHRAIYCADQSKATDTMLIAAQKLALTILFISVFEGDSAKSIALAEAWADMVSGEDNTFYMSNGKQVKYRMIVGQPQGYLSSFSSFALLNHFIMMFSLYKYCQAKGINEADASELYRLVGDDSIVMLLDNDPHGLFMEVYIMCNRMINVEVNPSKGYTNCGERTSTTTEFAKVLSINGEFFTPTPFNIASSSANTTAEGFLKYLLWIHEKTGYQFTVEKVIDLVKSRFKLNQKQLQGLGLVLTVKATNNEFYTICKENNQIDRNIEMENRLIWYNFVNLINKSLCKYGFSYSTNEEVLGVTGNGLAYDKMFEEVKFFKWLEKEFDINEVPKDSKLYLHYSNDFVKREIFPIIRENSTEDLISLVEESGILADFLLEALEQDLTRINENLETIVQVVSDGPESINDEVKLVIKKITPLLTQRSWSLKKYEVDCKYLEFIGEKLGDNFESFANEKLGTTLIPKFDYEPEQEVDLVLDIDLDFDF